ncbi:major surface protease gp63 [Novymonas esmeraldas]|uniref:Leishmanolysin-like peptidase n=1 Tax=Novymonas esmeraldas TaxID=1808958 RepID=A0AAW0F0J4_9TRYP
MRHVLLRAALVAVLVCAVVCISTALLAVGHADFEEHRCGFDEVHAQTMSARVSRVTYADEERSVVPASTAWQPIRIAVFTGDVADSSRYCTAAGQIRPNFRGENVVCGAEDILTSSKKQILMDLLIPLAVQLHTERLSVQRESGNIVVAPSIRRDVLCGQFNIPASHMTTGVANADFLLYVAAGPTSGNNIAWASTCQYFANGRPSVGVADLSPRYITPEPQKVRVVAHEILHALGFIFFNFQARSMVANVSNIRGKGTSPVINSTNVAAQAQAQYGCSAQTFMELEDAGESGTVYSHWKRRSAKDELMAGISGAGAYSALTIAAMEDMGYYRGNYSMAEPMMYGQSAGCSLTTDKCVVDGVSQFPEMFCSSSSTTMVCTSDRLGIGYCEMGPRSSALPPQFQYFANTSLGGYSVLMDYCPYMQSYTNGNCTYDTNAFRGSVFGVMSRCFDTPNGITEARGLTYSQYGICAEVQCGSSTYSVRVRGARTFTACTPGTSLSLNSLSSVFDLGRLSCPSYDSVCGIRVNATKFEEYFVPAGEENAAGAPARMAIALVVAAAAVALLLE